MVDPGQQSGVRRPAALELRHPRCLAPALRAEEHLRAVGCPEGRELLLGGERPPVDRSAPGAPGRGRPRRPGRPPGTRRRRATGARSRACCSLQTIRAGPSAHSRASLLRCRPRKVRPSWPRRTSTSPVSSARTSTKSKPVGSATGGSGRLPTRSSSQVRDRRAWRAVLPTSVCRKTSLNTSRDSGPSYPVRRTCVRNDPRSKAPSPGNRRWWRDQDSTSMLSAGASASCRKNTLSARDLLDRGRVVATGQDVEAVEADPDGVVVGELDDAPGPPVVVDVPPPGQRLEGDPHAVLGSRLPQSSQLARPTPRRRRSSRCRRCCTRAWCRCPVAASGRTSPGPAAARARTRPR